MPHILPRSIGWRMGDGEYHLGRWLDYVHRLTLDELVSALHRYPPAPMTWTRFVLPTVLARHGYDDAAVRQLMIAEKLVAVDAAFPAWLRDEQRRGGVRPPWKFVRWSMTIDDVVSSVCLRRFHFFCRWVQEERATGRIIDWRARHPDTPEGWRVVRDAVGGLDFPAGWLTSPWRHLARDLLMTGEPVAPWDVVRSPGPLRRLPLRTAEYEYLHAWRHWAVNAFDDSESLHAYRVRHPLACCPERWEECLDCWFRHLRRDSV